MIFTKGKESSIADTHKYQENFYQATSIYIDQASTEDGKQN